ncbi:MAG: hypothetical protein QNJ12_03670 [Ilumatobacter sp.]|uniref:hypothetical protein n=1 Tax=Ilumatobacter sp. TaxID=1967498 RepID=UPI002622D812|nr:hypothetical protein [Ilumatobacter sp.]MDJ0767861.1 hypothetical protein [Ilumatobacter sp.]
MTTIDLTTDPAGTDSTITDPASPADASRTALLVGLLQALVVANLVQVLAGFTGADPSPPADVVPGIAATALLGIAAVPMVRAGARAGYRLGIGFCLASMVGMGPHKLFMADGGVIAPMALVGFALEVAFIVAAVRTLRELP